jgi:hypothetical protein
VLGYKLGAGAGTTLGQAAQKLYSCSGASGDVVQTTAASQPLLLVHSGENYYYSGATSGNYVSTPDSVNATFSGDLDVRIRIKNFVNNQTQSYISKRGASGFVFYSDTSGLINLEPWGVVSTAAVSNGFNGWLRITKTSTQILFFTGTDSDNPTFTQLGTTISGTFANPISNINVLGIGGIYNTLTLSYFPSYCKILRVTKANSIGGAPVVDFNPNQYNAATSQTQWTSSTSGETWTINVGTAATGYKGVLVDRTIMQGDGIDDTITDTATYNQPYTVYNVGRVENSGVLVKSNSGGGYLSYVSNDTIRMIGSLSIVFANAGISFRKRNLISGVFNAAASVLAFNNSISTTGNAGTAAITTVFQIFDSNNSTQNTIIISTSADNLTVRTDMYDYIKSINNNAF